MAHSSRTNTQCRIAYGLNPHLPEFSGVTAIELGQRLNDYGLDGVFVKAPSLEFVQGLQAGGLAVYTSVAVFAEAGIWQRFPASRPVMADGLPAPKEEWYEPAIPTLPELREARLKKLESLARTLPLDGLWLDFIRWPARWELASPSLYQSSFDDPTLTQFQNDIGVTLPKVTVPELAGWLLNNMPDEWVRWRCVQVSSFVAEAKTLLKKYLSGSLLGVFTVPWIDDEMVKGVRGANIQIVGQDLGLMAQHADVISPMLYHRLCQRPATWPKETCQWLEQRIDVPVWPVIEAIKGDSYSAKEFATVVSSLGSASGVIVFTLEGLLADTLKLKVL